MIDPKLMEGCQRVKKAIESDYERFCLNGNYPDQYDPSDCEISFEPGRNYIRVVRASHGGSKSTAGFIVKKDTKGFVVGDMLKAAGWKAPATNFARGNVFQSEDMSVRWTGIQ